MHVRWLGEAAEEAGNDFDKAQAAVERILANIYSKTQVVHGWNGIRKLRVGDHRLFFVIIESTVYVLAYLPRKNCYKRKLTVLERMR